MRGRLVVMVGLVVLGGCLAARQLLAETVMVATLLATPDVQVGDQAFFPDGGTSGEEITVPGQTIAFAFVGQREEGALDTPPEPVEDATVTLVRAGGATVTLENDGDGRYRLTSAEDPALDYLPSATYEFRAAAGEQQYVGEVTQVPPAEVIAELHPPAGFILLDAAQGMTLTRPPPPEGEERPLGFVTVFELGSGGTLGEVTWTNIPDAPLEVLQLVARPAQWRRTDVAVSGEAFPSPESTYLVTFQAAKLGGAKSANLFVGSAILAGVADVGVVRTR